MTTSGLVDVWPLTPMQEGQARARAFELSEAPLLRFLLIRRGPERHRLVITNHHILMDGWSMPELVGELAALYASGGDGGALGAVTPYRDYLAWLGRQDAAAAGEAWRGALAGAAPTHPGPVDPARAPPMPRHVGVELPAGLTAGLSDLARRLGGTLNTLVQAGGGGPLGRPSASSPVAFVAPGSG